MMNQIITDESVYPVPYETSKNDKFPTIEQQRRAIEGLSKLLSKDEKERFGRYMDEMDSKND